MGVLQQLYEKRPGVDPLRSTLGCLVATLVMMAVCALVLWLGGYPAG
jgi:hypothetical protein